MYKNFSIILAVGLLANPLVNAASDPFQDFALNGSGDISGSKDFQIDPFIGMPNDTKSKLFALADKSSDTSATQELAVTEPNSLNPEEVTPSASSVQSGPSLDTSKEESMKSDSAEKSMEDSEDESYKNKNPGFFKKYVIRPVTAVGRGIKNFAVMVFDGAKSAVHWVVNKTRSGYNYLTKKDNSTTKDLT